jgi:hypothetical protein
MMELSFGEKTPSSPRKYQTSPIPNIIDQYNKINLKIGFPDPDYPSVKLFLGCIAEFSLV